MVKDQQGAASNEFPRHVCRTNKQTKKVILSDTKTPFVVVGAEGETLFGEHSVDKLKTPNLVGIIITNIEKTF